MSLKFHFLSFSAVVFLCLFARSIDSVALEDVQFVLASLYESPIDSCHRKGSIPLYPSHAEFSWNSTTLNYVVENYLHYQLADSGQSSTKGLIGCCAPGLWCSSTNGTCFTQGFGDQFYNYGWLNNDTTSVPVYACVATTPTLITVRSGSVDNTELSVATSSFSYSDSIQSAYIYGEQCSNLETCNCIYCDNSFLCPVGYRCVSGTGGNSGLCLLSCSEDTDESCPCNQQCRAVGAGQSTVNLCVPSTSWDQYVRKCRSSPGEFTCNSARSLQSAYVSASLLAGNSVNVSFATSSRAGYGHIDVDMEDQSCDSDSDCFDGNICTADQCDLRSKLCTFRSVNGCTSTLPTISARSTPYTYYSFYMPSNYVIKSYQSAAVQTISTLGRRSAASFADDIALDHIKSPFTVTYFGNKIKDFYLNPNGIIAIPPLESCVANEIGCFLFSTSANVISPFFTDWDPSASSSANIYSYIQYSVHGNAVFGVDADAVHFLYQNLRRYHSHEQNATTFAASVYGDGSVLLSFIGIGTSIDSNDFIGLWGSFAGDSTESKVRYHLENVTQQQEQQQVSSGSQMVYCPIQSLGCTRESCLAAGESLDIHWPGNLSCLALGNQTFLQMQCSFGGLGTSEASVTVISDMDTMISCSVPVLMNISSGSVISVDIEISAATTTAPSVHPLYEQDIGTVIGSKSIYTAFYGSNGEIAKAPIMISYYHTIAEKDSSGGTCGCNPLSAYRGQVCDRLLVCGGQNTTGDCAGTSFGSAYETSCQICAGGLTGVAPEFDCSGGSGSSLSDIISQTIILLMIICCMTFLTMSVSYSIRRMLAIRSLNDEISMFNEQLVAAETEMIRRQRMLTGRVNNGRGLSEFEREALGIVTFTKEFYKRHQSELHNKSERSPLAPSAPDDKQRHKRAASDTEDEAKDEEMGGYAPLNTRTSDPAVETDLNSDSCECSICLSEIEEGSQCRALPPPCGHIFHLSCIDEWFQQSHVCPLCKRSMRSLLFGEGNDENQQNLQQLVVAAGGGGGGGGGGDGRGDSSGEDSDGGNLFLNGGNFTFRIGPLRTNRGRESNNDGVEFTHIIRITRNAPRRGGRNYANTRGNNFTPIGLLVRNTRNDNNSGRATDRDAENVPIDIHSDDEDDDSEGV